jgi:hypothetical protein
LLANHRGPYKPRRLVQRPSAFVAPHLDQKTAFQKFSARWLRQIPAADLLHSDWQSTGCLACARHAEAQETIPSAAKSGDKSESLNPFEFVEAGG